MRLHSDTLTPKEIRTAVAAVDGVSIGGLTSHGSRSRNAAWELNLTGHGRSGGQWGNHSDRPTASWDDWGMVLHRLFDADPRMIVGTPGRPTYDGRDDFHAETVDRYRTLTPDQAHHQHKRDSGSYRDQLAVRYVSPSGRYLTRCKGSKDRPCDAYI